VIYVPSFIKIGSGIQKLIGVIHRYTHTQTAKRSHKPTLFFKNKASRLKMKDLLRCVNFWPPSEVPFKITAKILSHSLIFLALFDSA
jgi:hypothetical protein